MENKATMATNRTYPAIFHIVYFKNSEVPRAIETGLENVDLQSIE